MPHALLTRLAVSAALLAGTATAAAAEPPRVVASIQPVHGIAAAVMDGVAAPRLLLPPGASPHDYALKPSDARALSEADVVFWIGRPLESFLAKPLESLADDARVVALASAPGLTLLRARSGETWADHGHDHGPGEDHAHEHETTHDDDHGSASAEHAHEAGHDGHEGEGEGEHEHEHEHEHADGHGHAEDHGHGTADPAAAGDPMRIAPLPALSADAAALPADTDSHIWLDPRNAAAMAETMAAVLAEADPDNAAAYRANAAEFAAEVAALEADLRQRLAPVANVPYVVFHDAYHYLEHRFGLTAVGSVTVEPGRPVGARRVADLRDTIAALDAACVFAEPQFEPRLVATVTEGTGARAGVLDPLGTDLSAGPDLYPALMRSMADALTTCLTPTAR